jgi:hypothetical protein
MIQKWMFYSGLFISIIVLTSGFKEINYLHFPSCSNCEKEIIVHTVPTKNEFNKVNFTIPFTGKTFIGFQQLLAFKESQGKYNKVNTHGYLGKYQFGLETLKILGIRNTLLFLKNSSLQEKAFLANLARNKWELRDEIANYSGKIIKNIPITESGILAAAHLGGAGSVKRFLKTNGNRECKDSYGTSIPEYMHNFSGFDTSLIVANEKAKAKHY